MINLEKVLQFTPQHFSAPAPWAGHIPFARWLSEIQKPAIFVELGAYSGISYMAFCQSFSSLDIKTHAYAVDTWEGDTHAGFYEETIFNTLRALHDPRYGHFSKLLRMRFDEALSLFDDGSIDLLHIDGLHTYEAVRHDFETWLPKLSERSVVLFHDSNVFRNDFGVHQLWGELKDKYPSINFLHSNGLGVLLTGKNQPSELKDLCATHNHGRYQETFASMGARFELQDRILILENERHDLQAILTNERRAGQQRHDWIKIQDNKILQLENILHDQHTQNDQIQALLIEKNAAKDAELARIENDKNLLANEGALKDAELARILSSRSWKTTAGLRKIGGLARQIRSLSRKSKNAFSYVQRGDLQGLISRWKTIRLEQQQSLIKIASDSNAKISWAILTTTHTLFLANLIAQHLRKFGWTAEVLTASPLIFNHDYYFVLCPQMFSRLPPGEKRIAYQLEQSVSSRWFDKKYFDVLENSLAVLDYSLDNIAFLKNHGIAFPHVHYLPIGASAHEIDNHSAPEKKYDVLFYGDSLSSSRRRNLLDTLKSEFSVHIINDLFGDAVHHAIRQAKVVINIHYYENALLEMPRIQECLSLGTPVASESTKDMNNYPEIRNGVRFFQEGSAEEMLQVVREMLKNPIHASEISTAADMGARKFEFMLDRFLLAMGFHQASHIHNMTLPLEASASLIALSLPETTERRKIFESICPDGCSIFDGIRKSPGWIGCGLSYLSLANHALRNSLPAITVMEDDVTLPADFESQFNIIKDYLAHHSGWDVFAGVIASLHDDTKILKVETHRNIQFVTINKMTSMVFNIYDQDFLRLLLKWNPENQDSSNNTIDRFIESQADIQVVVTLPFLVGHREEVNSTLWGFQNSTYNDMIRDSELKIQRLVFNFIEDQRTQE